jgi:Ras-related protein Rab-8A
MYKKYDMLVKSVLLGEEGVGKTSLCYRLNTNNFKKIYETTIGVDFSSKIIEVNGKCYKLQLWDTAGQERFRCVVNSYFRRVDLAIIMFDYTNINSFKKLPYWIDQIKINSHNSEIIILGNKIDLGKVVTDKEVEDFFQVFNYTFIQISVKDNTNIKKLLEIINGKIRNIPLDELRRNSALKNLTKLDKVKKNCCSIQ